MSQRSRDCNMIYRNDMFIYFYYFYFFIIFISYFIYYVLEWKNVKTSEKVDRNQDMHWMTRSQRNTHTKCRCDECDDE